MITDKIEKWKNKMDVYYEESSREQFKKDLNLGGFVTASSPSINWHELDKQYGNLMDDFSKKGTKVRYIARNGYDWEVPAANKYLREGEVYTVNYTQVGCFLSVVNLEEVPGHEFNTVMFEKVGD